MHIPALAGEKDVEINMFVDSGAGGIFIHPRVVIRLRLEPKRLAKSIPVFNVDNTPNKSRKITHEVIVPVRMGTETRRIRAWVTDIGKEDFILGFPWLKQENPDIDWGKGQVTLKRRKPWREVLATARKQIASWNPCRVDATIITTNADEFLPSAAIPKISRPTVAEGDVSEEDNKPKESTFEPQESLEEALNLLEDHAVVISYIHGESIIGVHAKEQSPLTRELVDESSLPRSQSTINRFLKSLGGCFTRGLSIGKTTTATELARAINSKKKDKRVEDLVPRYLHDYYSVF